MPITAILIPAADCVHLLHQLVIGLVTDRLKIAKIVGSKLIIDRFIYLRCHQCGICTYWDCQKVRAGECTARAITAAAATDEGIAVIRGLAE